MPEDPTVLIFDSDDTLWENNILFETVIDDFVAWLNHPTLAEPEIRTILNDIERANSAAHGYGSTVFLRSLRECFQRLHERPVTEDERAAITELAEALLAHKVELVPGVDETLCELADRYRLLLLTKGETAEQQRKLDVSTLAQHFTGVHIVPEKAVHTYQWLLETHGLRPDAVWMIGNSPKSDIVPARQAGINAVFIPNDNTWALEHDELDPGDDQVLWLRRFPELLEHF